MSKVKFFLGQPKQVEFEAKRPMIVEESKVQSNYTENDQQAPSHILNRPFYSETVTEPLEIKWDGAWGGRPYNVVLREGINGVVSVKVTDMVFTVEKLRSAYVTLQGAESETVPVSDLVITDTSIGTLGVYIVSAAELPLVTVITEDGAIDGISFEKGTYFCLLQTFNNNDIQREFVSSLSFPSITYTKYYKLDNNFVDAEWMATESTGEGTKKFELKSIYDVSLLGAIDESATLFRLDSRFYTKEELLGARLILNVRDALQLSWVAAYEDNTFSGVVAYRMIWLEESTEIVLLSVEEDIPVGEVTLEKGLYLSINGFGADEEISGTLEIYNATGQSLPNKLPNKFLDLDWVPKADTYAELLYEGTIEGEGSEVIPFDPQLLDLDTTLLLTANGVTIEARAAGTPLFDVLYFFHYTEEDFIYVSSYGTAAYLDYNVAELMMDVSIKIVKKAANPIPRHFLPEGVGNKVVVEIDHPLADGLEGYEATIGEAWNSGATVVLQFSDYTLSLLSFELNLDGVDATAVTDLGRYYRFSATAEGGWALSTNSASEDPSSVLYKAEGSTEFVPTALNATLTEGSTLPAQEGAVFTAIQNLQETIGTLNQDLENRLNGGT